MDQVIIEYGARLDKLEKDLKGLERGLRGVDDAAKQSSDGVVNSFKRVEKESNNLNNNFKKIGSALAGYFAASSLLDYAAHVRDVTVEFQKLEAVLTNTLGSSSAAQKALLDIQEFAAKTPFSVTELTQSFVKLANQGFKPTTEELRKLGDLASSTGKSFDQLAEAVIDAQTGEFERLKEFGIRASKEGDKVKFTFKGVQQEVDFTSKAIQNYVLSLGDVEGVSGSMDAISKTLGGQLSNLKDEFDQLAKTLGGNFAPELSYAIDLIGQATRAAREFLESDFTQKQREYNEAANELLKTFEGFTELQINEKIAELTKEIDRLDIAFNRNNDAVVAAKSDVDLLDKALSGLGITTSSSQKTIEEYGAKNEEIRKTINTYQIAVEQLKIKLVDLSKETKNTQKSQEELDKEFKKQLDTLKALEDIAIRRGKLEDGTEGQIIKVQEDFNQKRISLYRKYAKTQEVEYKSLKLREKELEKEYTQFLVDEENNRTKNRKAASEKIKTERFKELDDLQKQQELIVKESQLDELKQVGTNKKVQKELQEQFDRDDLQGQINFLESKKQLQLLYGDSTLDTEKEILDAKEKLYQLDVEKANEAEDEKKKKRDANAKLIIDSAQVAEKAVQAINDVENQRIQAKYENERSQIQKTTDFQLSSLDKRVKAGIISEEEAAIQKDRIQKEAARKEAAIKKQQFIADRNAKLIQIGIETAFGVVKAVAASPTTYGLPFSAFVLAEGGIQAAAVRSQPVPKFEKGGKVKGPRHSEGGKIVEVEGGEFIHSRKAVHKYGKAITAIHEDKFDKYVSRKYVAPALKRAKADVEAFERQKQSTAENILKAMSYNGMDLSYLETLTKRNNKVSIQNADYLADRLANRMRKGGLKK